MCAKGRFGGGYFSKRTGSDTETTSEVVNHVKAPLGGIFALVAPSEVGGDMVGNEGRGVIGWRVSQCKICDKFMMAQYDDSGSNVGIGGDLFSSKYIKSFAVFLI